MHCTRGVEIPKFSSIAEKRVFFNFLIERFFRRLRILLELVVAQVSKTLLSKKLIVANAVHHARAVGNGEVDLKRFREIFFDGKMYKLNLVFGQVGRLIGGPYIYQGSAKPS